MSIRVLIQILLSIFIYKKYMISFVITKTIELNTSKTVGRLTTSYPEIKGSNPATELYLGPVL